MKDLLGGDYWADIDKFAERDFGSNTQAYQNNLDYYNKYGHAHAAKVGDKYSYDYYAHVLSTPGVGIVRLQRRRLGHHRGRRSGLCETLAARVCGCKGHLPRPIRRATPENWIT